MELVDLMKKISEDNIPHFLILFGNEQKILELYVDKIIEKLQAKKVICESVSNFISISGRKSIDKSKKVYVVQEDTNYVKAEDSWDKIQKQVKHNYLILRYNSLDKRSAFVKKNQQNIVEFAYLSDEVLQQYIQRDLPNLSDENISKLIGYCNNDYGRILLEIDKVKQYMKSIKSNNEDKCFNGLDKQGLFHKEIGDITFELTDAVLGGYPDTAIKKLDEAKRKGEPAMMIATILYTGFRNLLAYQGLGKNKQGAVERTGMTNGEVWRCSKLTGGYTINELKRNMFLCQHVESGIKMGIIDEDIALEYLVLSCLK